MRHPNLRHLEIFRTLVQTLSVTETAKLHNISQPAVSKAISQLQDTVGLTLFQRVRGRLQPSSDTMRLLAETERLLNQVALFGDEIDALHEALHGRLTIAAIPALAIGGLAEGVGRFLRDYPKVQVEFQAEMSQRIVDDVASHKIELGFIHGDPQSANVRAIHIEDSEMACQVSVQHPLARKAIITAEDLRGQPLVFLNPASPPNHLIRENFARAGVRPEVVAEINASHLAGPVVHHGAVAFVDPISADTGPSGTTVCRPFRPRVPLAIYAISSAVRPVSNLSQLFSGIATHSIRQHLARALRELGAEGNRPDRVPPA
ncbi:LysR family transcriptional regulator [Pelagibacterium montanilacus]|uniref:LysR family transcriptional regulator n=1 Tax=Pelagibacterium montanilacus TaxID=2185280 RepID=UPI000F8CAC7D|nr:LysR substrate-binding domain-containing protein [Pelagibacterium montanilacus]